jgi:hypothetical protein
MSDERPVPLPLRQGYQPVSNGNNTRKPVPPQGGSGVPSSLPAPQSTPAATDHKK